MAARCEKPCPTGPWPLAGLTDSDEYAAMGNNVEVLQRHQQPIAVVRDRVQPEGISEFLGSAFDETMAVVGHQRLDVTGAPFARYSLTDDARWDVEAGFPVDAPPLAEGRVLPDMLPGGTVARILHVGEYAAVGVAYETLLEWLPANGYQPTGDPWEEYLDRPSTPNPRTEVYVPCAAAQ